jgi:tetratricopeptide (TPR) repeat protein
MTNIAVRLGNASEARRWAQKAYSYHPHIPEIRDIHSRLEYAPEPARPTIDGLVCVILAEDNDSGLQRALFSAKGISRSVVVLHHGNESFVQMLAQQQGVEYKQVPATFTHADMMNHAITLAQGTWLLLLWHDEALTSEQEEYLRINLPNIHPSAEALTVRIEQRPDELGIRSESVRLVRLPSKAQFVGAAHPRLKQGTATIEHSQLFIHRFALPMSAAKQQRYARLLELAALQQSDTSADELFDLAMYLLNFGSPQVEALAVKAMQRYAVSPFRHGAKTAVLLNSFSRRLITKGDFTTLSDIAAFSVEAEPRQTEAYWYLYLAETASGNSDKLYKRYLALTTALENRSTSAIAPEKQPELGQVAQFGLESAISHGNMDFARAAVDFALRNNALRVVKNTLIKYAQTERIHIISVLNDEFRLQLPLNIGVGPSTSVSASVTSVQEQKRPLLSLCMIVKNEEAMLEGCLQSVQDIADEIVIADTGSTDGTIAVAERYNARVISVEWNNDFAAARNAALQQCTCEWILYLDADERIASGQREYILELLKTLPEHIGGVICTIRSPHRMAGEQSAESTVHSGGYPRLFRNYGHPNIMFTGRVHEQISPSLIALGKELTDSAIEIQHLGYDCDPATMEKKVRRNYELLLQHVKEEPDNAYSWFQLGQTLGFMNMDSQAISTLEFAIALGTLQPHIWASAAASISQMYGRQKNFSAALEWADKSLEQSPNQLRALNLRAHA